MGLRPAILAATLLFGCAGPPPPPQDTAALTAVLTRAWEAQMAELRVYDAYLRQGAVTVIAEVPFETNRPEAYARFLIADFGVARDSISYLVRREMPPGPVTAADGVYLHTGVTITVEALDWDRTLLAFQAPEQPDEALRALLVGWQYDERSDSISQAPGHIHSVVPRAAGLAVDFGTAPPAAFLDLVEALAGAGVTRMRVNAGR